MNKISSIILFLTIALTTVSCGGKEEPQGKNWGHTKYYKDFPHKDFPLMKYTPVIMSNTLEVELNNDAARFFYDDNAFIKLCISSSPNEFKKPENLVVYFNNEKCENYTFDLKPKEQIKAQDETLMKDTYTISGELGIELKNEATDGEHRFYVLYSCCDGRENFSLKDSNDEIQGRPEDVEKNCLYEGSIENGLYLTKETIMNPLKKWTIIIITSVTALYLLWLLILRPAMYPHFRHKELCIKYPSSREERYVKIRGYCSLILTNKEVKQSALKKLFRTCDVVEVNKVWTSTVVIKPKGRNDLKVTGDIRCSTDDPIFGEMFKIKTNEGAEITIE